MPTVEVRGMEGRPASATRARRRIGRFTGCQRSPRRPGTAHGKLAIVNRVAVPVLAAALATACGSGPDDPKDVLGKLNKLPGVHAEQMSTDTVGYTYYVLQGTQPVDHDAPHGQTLQPEV